MDQRIYAYRLRFNFYWSTGIGASIIVFTCGTLQHFMRPLPPPLKDTLPGIFIFGTMLIVYIILHMFGQLRQLSNFLGCSLWTMLRLLRYDQQRGRNDNENENENENENGNGYENRNEAMHPMLVEFISNKNTGPYMTIKMRKECKYEQTICSICLDDFTLSEHVSLLPDPCFHIFHKDCLFLWITRHNTCPNCKHEFLTPHF